MIWGGGEAMLHDVHVHNGLDAPHSEAIGKGRPTLGTDITYDHNGVFNAIGGSHK